jgi:hypothetical protein
MRGKSISTDETTGTTRTQPEDEPCSYHRMLECVRSQYERMDVAKPRVVKVAQPMAEISWTTADVMRRASDTAFALEAHRRGLCLVSAKNILSGKYPSGKKPLRRKQDKSLKQG